MSGIPAWLMPPYPAYYLLSRVQIYHKDKAGVLHLLQKFDLSERILDAIARGERSTQTLYFTNGDLKRLKQLGLEDPSEMDLVVEFPWDATIFTSIVTYASNYTQFRRRVLEMALDRIRRAPSLRRILKVKGLAKCKIRENPYLGPGHAPYQNFVESLLDITDTYTPEGEKLFELFLESAGDEANETALAAVEKLGIRTVFHGTNHAVMDAILCSGLDPSYRADHLTEDYFGVDYKTSLRYTKYNTAPRPKFDCKLLVFMIILQPVGSSGSVKSRGAVSVQSNKFQLPLAEITL